MYNQPTAKLTEPTTDENRAGKAPSPTPDLLMSNAAGAGTCIGDTCTAREG